MLGGVSSAAASGACPVSTGARASASAGGLVRGMPSSIALAIVAPVSPTKVRRRTGSSSCLSPSSRVNRPKTEGTCGAKVSPGGMARRDSGRRGARPRLIRAGSGRPRPLAMCSNTSSFSTCWTPRMMSLTLPCGSTHAMPIWVWTYTAPDGKTFRPSLFVTLTCPSYGRVCEDGAPADPDTYDYRHAARDALHFAALFDRFIQNLRRFCGYDLQYFAAIAPQKRLAPHVHIAIRGTISRAELREVIAATYHQVWWPSTADRQVRRRAPAGLGRADRDLPRPGHRPDPGDVGSGARHHRRR